MAPTDLCSMDGKGGKSLQGLRQVGYSFLVNGLRATHLLYSKPAWLTTWILNEDVAIVTGGKQRNWGCDCSLETRALRGQTIVIAYYSRSGPEQIRSRAKVTRPWRTLA